MLDKLCVRNFALIDELEVDFGDLEFETLNGYIISKLDHIPDEDEFSEVQIDGYNFKINKVEKNVIQSVILTKIQE